VPGASRSGESVEIIADGRGLRRQDAVAVDELVMLIGRAPGSRISARIGNSLLAIPARNSLGLC